MSVKDATVPEIPPTVSYATGSAWATLLSAGIGCAAFGVFTMLSECVPAMSRSLNWYNPSGPLSGVATCAVVIWLVAWMILSARWNNRSMTNERALLIVTLVLVLVGILTTFPPFYDLFGG